MVNAVSINISHRRCEHIRRRSYSTSLNELEDIFVVKSNIELPKQCQVLIPKRIPLVVLLLILNVANDGVQLGVAVRERAVTFLPIESSMNESSFVNEGG